MEAGVRWTRQWRGTGGMRWANRLVGGGYLGLRGRGGNLPGDFVEAVEDEGVAPHGDCDGVVAVREAVRANEEALGARGCPDGEEAEYVDEVAEVGKEVVVAFAVVGVPSDGHKVAELCREPEVEAIGVGAD